MQLNLSLRRALTSALLATFAAGPMGCAHSDAVSDDGFEAETIQLDFKERIEKTVCNFNMPSPVGAESFTLTEIAEADRLTKTKTLVVGQLSKVESGIIFWTLIASDLLEPGDKFEDKIDDGTSFELTDIKVKGKTFTWLEFSTSDTGGGGAFVKGPGGLQLVAVAGDSEFRGCQLNLDPPPPVDVKCRRTLNNPFDNKKKTADQLTAFEIDSRTTTGKTADKLTALQAVQIVAASNSKSLANAFKNSDDNKFRFARLRKFSNARSNKGKAIDYDYVSYLDDGVRIGRVFFAGSQRAVARIMKDTANSSDKILGCFPKLVCDVTSVASATVCLNSQGLEVGGEPNSFAAATIAKAEEPFSRVVSGLGFQDGSVGLKEINEALEGADYLAAVTQHFDEDQIIYYAIVKGKKSEPSPLTTMSFPDDLDPYPTSVDPLDWSFGIKDVPDWHYDELQEAFDEAKAEEDNVAETDSDADPLGVPEPEVE